MSIKISVVIPTYNRPNLLLNCLTALENQSIRKDAYEVIIASDGPDLETRRVIKNWLTQTDMQVVYVSGIKKVGPAETRNRGWKFARAEFIAFTDDDCLPDHYWLSVLLNQYGGENLIAFSGRTQVFLPQYPTDFQLNLAKLGGARFITANCACTKNALMKVGGFDERFKMAWREDSDLEFKFMTHQIPIQKISDAIVVHPVYLPKWGISISEQGKGIYDALLYKKYPELYKKNIEDHSLWMYYLMAFSFFACLYFIFIRSWLGMIVSGVCYLILLSIFIFKRLKETSKAPGHVFEMMCTSLVIPFLSIYYRLYGAVKFRILFF